jgi:hypothetical protein
MTARAGDALSHVYFSWPARQFSRQFSNPISSQFSSASSQRIRRHDFAAGTPVPDGASAASLIVPSVFAWAP